MVVKKKSAKVVKTTEEERRPPVTQVVEVVEDSDESTHTAVAEPPSPSSEPEDQPVEGKLGEVDADGPKSPSEEKESTSSTASDDEKRRVLVDELFQKKTDQSREIIPEISVHRKAGMRPIMLWAIIIVVASLVVGGTIMVMFGNAGSFPSIISSPSPTPTFTPTPSPTPDLTQLDRSKLSVQVLNGSGTVGAAAKMKETLEQKGYTVEDTSNADNYDYTSTEIFAKAESQAYLVLLEADLKESYNLGTTAATLASDVPYDIRIVVGKE